MPGDSIPPLPDPHWEDIPLGAGQVPGVPVHKLQYTRDGDSARGTDVRRHPDYDSIIITDVRPERPA